MIEGFDHVNLRTPDLDRAVDWYGRILGMYPGPRPDFGFGGAWLYIGDQAIVHLVEVDSLENSNAGPVTLEHFALRASGYDDFLALLEREGVPYRLGRLDDPVARVVQVNISDPDGNHIHVDFSLEDAER